MAIASTASVRQAINIANGVPIDCDFALFNVSQIRCLYCNGNYSDTTLGDEYSINIADDNYSFTFTPHASLLTKINAKIAADDTEQNIIWIIRDTDQTTGAEPANSTRANFLYREFERHLLREQESDYYVRQRALRAYFGVNSAKQVSDLRAGYLLVSKHADEMQSSDILEADILNVIGNPLIIAPRIAVITKQHGFTFADDLNAYWVNVNSDDPEEIILPANAPEGSNVLVVQTGEGPLTAVAGAGATLKNIYNWFTTAGERGKLMCVVSFNNVGNTSAIWDISGDVSPDTGP